MSENAAGDRGESAQRHPVVTPLGEQGARRVEQGPPRRRPPLGLRAPSLLFPIYIHTVCTLPSEAGGFKG